MGSVRGALAAVLLLAEEQGGWLVGTPTQLHCLLTADSAISPVTLALHLAVPAPWICAGPLRRQAHGGMRVHSMGARQGESAAKQDRAPMCTGVHLCASQPKLSASWW